VPALAHVGPRNQESVWLFKLEAYLDEYIAAARTQHDMDGALFRMTGRSTGVLHRMTSRMATGCFVPPGSLLRLQRARSINDRGEIVVNGLLPNGDFHAVLLIPCGGITLTGEDCQHADESGAASTRKVVARGNLTPETLAAIRARLGRQFPYPGLGRVPAPPK